MEIRRFRVLSRLQELIFERRPLMHILGEGLFFRRRFGFLIPPFPSEGIRDPVDLIVYIAKTDWAKNAAEGFIRRMAPTLPPEQMEATNRRMRVVYAGGLVKATESEIAEAYRRLEEEERPPPPAPPRRRPGRPPGT